MVEDRKHPLHARLRTGLGGSSKTPAGSSSLKVVNVSMHVRQRPKVQALLLTLRLRWLIAHCTSSKSSYVSVLGLRVLGRRLAGRASHSLAATTSRAPKKRGSMRSPA